MGIFNEVEKNNLAKAIIAITGGQRERSIMLTRMAVRVPEKFKEKSVEEDKNILIDLLTEIVARKAVK